MWEFLVPVFFFTYFLIYIQDQFLKSKGYKWLYAPFIFTLIIDTILHLDYSFSLYRLPINEEDFAVEALYSLEDSFAIIYNIVFIFLARVLIIRSKKISALKKKWLLRLNAFIILIITFWLISEIEDGLFGTEFSTQILWIIISAMSWWIMYYGVFRLQIVTQKDEIHDFLLSKKEKQSPNKKQNTTSKVISQLNKMLEDDEIFKNPLLGRLDLAQKLGISEGYLSQLVNQELDTSVGHLISNHRVKSAKGLLQDPVFSKYSIEAIGMEVGFNSKSVFYSTFKNIEGVAPGEYRKLQTKS